MRCQSNQRTKAIYLQNPSNYCATAAHEGRVAQLEREILPCQLASSEDDRFARLSTVYAGILLTLHYCLSEYGA